MGIDLPPEVQRQLRRERREGLRAMERAVLEAAVEFVAAHKARKDAIYGSPEWPDATRRVEETRIILDAAVAAYLKAREGGGE